MKVRLNIVLRSLVAMKDGGATGGLLSNGICDSSFFQQCILGFHNHRM